jgi:hypothetical protein
VDEFLTNSGVFNDFATDNQKVINTGHNNSNGVSMELASVISHTTQKLRKQASLNEYEGEQRRASGTSIALNMKPPGRHGVNSQIFRRDTNQNLQTSPGRDYRGPLESNMLMTPDISQQLRGHRPMASGDFWNKDVTMIEQIGAVNYGSEMHYMNAFDDPSILESEFSRNDWNRKEKKGSKSVFSKRYNQSIKS